jgi:hypothetical protein
MCVGIRACGVGVWPYVRVGRQREPGEVAWLLATPDRSLTTEQPLQFTSWSCSARAFIYSKAQANPRAEHHPRGVGGGGRL